MNRRPFNTRPGRSEIWNQRTAVESDPRRVMFVHSESDVGESFAMMLAMRGFDAVQIADAQSALHFAHMWRPQVLFIDTRVNEAHEVLAKHDHALVRALRECGREASLDQMLIAFAAEESSDPRDVLLSAGYDGFFRMPCPVWRLFDAVTRFYVH
ncbi:MULTISPECIES: response regulator [unclassified Caballeronia]|uniref:response regulator n=1 Tax=unclassified Caballeronia TaxID=2646786 RepID=UPI00285672E9|nr:MULTISPECIES: response regulator [unclassified Caballeronia]MDR5771529.1 response regulator [Caballeronia sp. LZ002]MDR5846965.1 response regulator [Caballeronia sp. LZ003]